MGTLVKVQLTGMKLSELRPGMEHIDLLVELQSFEEPREVTTYSGIKHTLVEGRIMDESTEMNLTVWNELIPQLDGLKPGDKLKLSDCFISSFKGNLSVNVGRDSSIHKE
ncbi:MAG: hypothetical protein NWE89_05745 [Candidatus Bathyarchaeota archaeon]|nr:hypothetical protein [Candidatus Bathyarchaeota archaeon]